MIFNKSALNVSTRGFKTLSYTLEYFIHKYKDIKPIKKVGKSSVVVDPTFHNYIISRYIYEPRGEALGRLAQSTSFNYSNVSNVNVQKKLTFWNLSHRLNLFLRAVNFNFIHRLNQLHTLNNVFNLNVEQKYFQQKNW